MDYKVAVQILYTQDWIDIGNITVKNAVQYCYKHLYSPSMEAVPSPYNGFRKFERIKETFRRLDHNLILSLDCDSLITNHNIKVEDFVDENHDFFITKDVNNINAGSFIIKCTDWAMNFIDWILKQAGRPDMHCEQDAIIAYMNEYPKSPIKILPHPSINSYKYELYPEHTGITHDQGNYEEGDFVLHLPGISMDKRLEILKNTPIIL